MSLHDATKMMGSAARLHRHDTRFELCRKFNDAIPPRASPQNNGSTIV
jgi:hypothetical protein